VGGWGGVRVCTKIVEKKVPTVPCLRFLSFIVLDERFKISGKLKGGGGASRFFADAGQKPTDSYRDMLFIFTCIYIPTYLRFVYANNCC
jgi:hypothetical protein